MSVTVGDTSKGGAADGMSGASLVADVEALGARAAAAGAAELITLS